MTKKEVKKAFSRDFYSKQPFVLLERKIRLAFDFLQITKTVQRNVTGSEKSSQVAVLLIAVSGCTQWTSFKNDIEQNRFFMSYIIMRLL